MQAARQAFVVCRSSRPGARRHRRRRARRIRTTSIEAALRPTDGCSRSSQQPVARPTRLAPPSTNVTASPVGLSSRANASAFCTASSRPTEKEYVMDVVSSPRTRRARRDDGRRGRRRRARRDGDGDRGRRPLRHRPAPPAARPRRAGRATRRGATSSPERSPRRRERRLEALVESNDGFELAEVDLELRGEGTILGARQKGTKRSAARLAAAATVISSCDAARRRRRARR